MAGDHASRASARRVTAWTAVMNVEMGQEVAAIRREQLRYLG